MAGSAMTFAYDDEGPVRRVVVDWTSDDGTGAVSGTTRKIVGALVRGVTDPSGTAAPTDDYDVTITDENGVDVLAGCQKTLANRDTANTEEAYFFLLNADASAVAEAAFPVVCDKLTVAVTNAGNSKQGRIVVYYRPGGA